MKPVKAAEPQFSKHIPVTTKIGPKTLAVVLAVVAGVAMQYSISGTSSSPQLATTNKMPEYAYYPDTVRYAYNGWCRVAPFQAEHRAGQG